MVARDRTKRFTLLVPGSSEIFCVLRIDQKDRSFGLDLVAHLRGPFDPHVQDEQLWTQPEVLWHQGIKGESRTYFLPMLTWFVSGIISVTVRLTSCFTSLEWPSLLMLDQQKTYLLVGFLTSQTEGQQYSDTFYLQSKCTSIFSSFVSVANEHVHKDPPWRFLVKGDNQQHQPKGKVVVFKT